ncbi:MAG: hypothetical protein ACE5PM_00240 [Candidatus Hydrothermarchaeales archaeon]
MDVVRSFKDSFHIYKDNLIFLLPHLVKYVIDIGLLLVFGFLALLVIGLGISRIAFASLYDPKALISHLGASGFFVIFILLLGFLLLVLVTTFLNASARVAIIGMAEEGIDMRKTDLMRGWSSVKKHALKVFGFMILLFFLLIIAILPGFLPLILVAIAGASRFLMIASVILGLLSAMILFLLIFVVTLFTPQCIVLEDTGIYGGIKGSYAFVRKNILEVLVYGVVVMIILIVVGIVTVGIFVPLNFIVGGSVMGKFIVESSRNLFSLLVGLILAPYFEIVKTHMVVSWREEVIG